MSTTNHSGPSPTVEDMSQVLEFLQLWHAVEPYKAYPREPWVWGRVRVRLVDEDGIPWNPEVPDRECLTHLIYLAPFLSPTHTHSCIRACSCSCSGFLRFAAPVPSLCTLSLPLSVLRDQTLPFPMLSSPLLVPCLHPGHCPGPWPQRTGYSLFAVLAWRFCFMFRTEASGKG